MSSAPNSGTNTPDGRFTSQSKTAEDLLANQTIGLVALSDFRKRRAEALEQKDRDLHDAVLRSGSGRETPGTATPGSDGASTPSEPVVKKKKRKVGTPKLSFGDDDEGEDNVAPVIKPKSKPKSNLSSTTSSRGETPNDDDDDQSVDVLPKKKFTANSSVTTLPKALTKAALLREAQTRETFRKEFLLLQEAVKATEISIPFVFYDGANIPGGQCRVKKGDPIWLFLDRSRKVGAELGVGGGDRGEGKARREWARVSVDDLMLVRGELIIPPHYDFYYFIINRTLGPNNRVLFDYSTKPPSSSASSRPDTPLLSNPSKSKGNDASNIQDLEGASDDPTFTKVVDRRWYERNKHIYPANIWQDFDPERDYQKEVRRDAGGNTLFFS